MTFHLIHPSQNVCFKRQKLITEVISLVILLFISLTQPIQAVAAGSWRADLTVNLDKGRQRSQPGIEDWLDKDLPNTLRQKGVNSKSEKLVKGIKPGEKAYQLGLSGSGGSNQFRQAVFGDLARLLDISDGPMTIEIKGKVQKGENLSFNLTSNPSTGYAWQVEGSNQSTLLESIGPTKYQKINRGIGVPEHQQLGFKARGNGDASLKLVYKRSWENLVPTRVLTLSATQLGELVDLTSPTAVVSPAPEAPVTGGEPDEPVGLMGSGAPLPSSFDRRSLGQVPPIRNQGACGSCWAFGTFGTLEVAMMAHQGGGPAPDLSEQYLLSCNYDGWSCGGGFIGHDYQWWKKRAIESQGGAVPEAEFPYVASMVSCGGPYSHPVRINTWSRIANTYAGIKQAIYDYGAVDAYVCVGSAFQGYTGGVFAIDEKICGSDKTNHSVTLVGWDDTAGPNGAYILRNSWGPSWGNGGYMKIDPTVSYIGEYSSYVVYNGDNPSYGVCTSAAIINCSGTSNGNNSGLGSTNLLPKYTGSTRDESGREYTYSFIPNATGPVTASLTGMSANLDIFALSNAGNSCNSSNSLSYGDSQVTFNVTAGQQYYLVVDGYQGAISNYTLSVNCSGVVPSPTPTQIPPTPTVPAGKPGDANNDGKVDGQDYVKWLNYYNTSSTGPTFGDFDNNNLVDGRDYVVWLNNYGKL
jgi:C1A family cysteine protease